MKVLEIESCEKCPICHFCKFYNYPTPKIIAIDCPLKDKSEPITENWLANRLGLHLTILTNEINAHFLGKDNE